MTDLHMLAKCNVVICMFLQFSVHVMHLDVTAAHQYYTWTSHLQLCSALDKPMTRAANPLLCPLIPRSCWARPVKADARLSVVHTSNHVNLLFAWRNFKHVNR